MEIGCRCVDQNNEAPMRERERATTNIDGVRAYLLYGKYTVSMNK